MSFINKPHDELTIFRNRLIQLMEKNQICSVSELAEKLKETSLLKRRYSTGREASLTKGSIEKLVQKHLNEYCEPGELPSSLLAIHIKAYCDVLHCSSDYLLGSSNIITPDPALRGFIEKTGLSESSVIQLYRLTNPEKYFFTFDMSRTDSIALLSKMLGANELPSFIKRLNEIQQFHSELSSIKHDNTAWDKLEAQIGQERLRHAIYLGENLDELYDGPPPSDEEFSDIAMLNHTMDEDRIVRLDEGERIKFQNLLLKVQKYELVKAVSAYFDNIFPDKC